MDITDATPARTQLAMDRFASGEDCLEFNGISFRILSSGDLEVAAISQWQAQHVTEQTARRELLRGRQAFQHLRDVSPDFRSAVAGRSPRHCVIDDDCKGSHVICREQGDSLAWASGFPCK